MNVISFFTRHNFHIHRIQKIKKTGQLIDIDVLDPPCIVTYEYNLQKHKYLLTTKVWPPSFTKGFMVPIRKVVHDGKDVIEDIMPFLGPRKTDIHCIFIRRKPILTFHLIGFKLTMAEFVVPYWKGTIDVEDIFSRTSRREVEFNLAEICD